MLDTLRIKNVALIDELEICFGSGLNVMSGETGAGKSIIIDALGFVLGGRAGKDFIKSGADTARVEAVITVKAGAMAALAELDIEPDGDGALFISRALNADGKSAARLNGRTVTGGLLKELSGVLVDIHSQHQHQSLLDPNKHITLLDRFCGGELPALKTELADICKLYREAKQSVQRISASPEDMESKIELYTYQVDEIEAAGLRPDEEDELLDRRRLLNASEKLTAASHKILGLLYDGSNSALDKLSSAQGLMDGISGYDGKLAGFSAVLDGAYADLDDLVREFRRFAENLPRSGEELDEVEERLNELYRLKRKYGRGIPEIIEFGARTREKLDLLLNSGAELERLEKEQRQLKTEALALCSRVSAYRKEAAVRIRREIESVLHILGMKNAQFEIEIEKRDDFGPDGYDKIEFLISANPGEALKPLARIASGGEMSRVMLALKTALADFDCIETFIFDEIDTGVSGRTAQMVAEKLSSLGLNHQIVCVTHLPQIAAMGDQNYLISKTSADGATRTGVNQLDRAGIIRELARLTGGAEITEATLAAADEMKVLADGMKKI
ncbi:MAG: DNA repair protein RecN [Defluviitaleaceae bacterium]|nr:DNA repair protein RecN [Defluviitaleaceae bacterium]MCL2836763.1 DNA repair protein RecN [Defluviitaleaceae bacterium]